MHIKHLEKCQVESKQSINLAVISFKYCQGLRKHSQKHVILMPVFPFFFFSLHLGAELGIRKPVFK